MRSIFTAKERNVILFLSVIFLLGNGVRIFRSFSEPAEGQVLDLGTLEPADSVEVAKLLQKSLEIRRQREAAEHVEFPLDINKASSWEMIALPGIGPERAASIIEERERRGGFHSVTELLDIPGIGSRTLAALDEFIQPIQPPSGKDSTTRDSAGTDRVDPNKADRQRLEFLPGIGPVLADRIVSYRERHGPFRSLEDLKDVKGIGESLLNDLEPYLTID